MEVSACAFAGGRAGGPGSSRFARGVSASVPARVVPAGSAGELRVLAARLGSAAAPGHNSSVEEALVKLERAASELAVVWSGSNMGSHSCVYYAEFAPPPPGAQFDAVRGSRGPLHHTTGDWREYRFDDVVNHLSRVANVVSLDYEVCLATDAHRVWTETRPQVVAVLCTYLERDEDAFIEQLRTEAESVGDISQQDAAGAIVAQSLGELSTREPLGVPHVLVVAPHQSVQARVNAVRSAFDACSTLARIAERGALRLERLQ